MAMQTPEQTCEYCRHKYRSHHSNVGGINCPRCIFTLRMLWRDERTDTKTGPQIKTWVCQEFADVQGKQLLERVIEGLYGQGKVIDSVTENSSTDSIIIKTKDAPTR